MTMIDQVTVFIENGKGHLTALCRVLGDAGINMHALTVADTADYGVARIICDDPKKAAEALDAAGFRAMTTQVVAVEVPDVPGGLADIFTTLRDADINIEYSYCFVTPATGAINAFKASEHAATVLEEAGYRVIQPVDLYRID
jgi:hypothetical protein